MTTTPPLPRRATRVSIRLPLQLEVEGAEISIETEAINMSQTGMFVATRLPLAVGTQVHLAATMGDGQVLFDVAAVVVRQQADSTPTGLGIKFLGLPEGAAELIARLTADETHFGQYRLEALVGRGGMAEVFRARVLDGNQVGRLVALKRLLPSLAGDPRFVDLFVSEADEDLDLLLSFSRRRTATTPPFAGFGMESTRR